MSGKRVLVCGGREFSDRDLLARKLSDLDIALLIHGGARGADSMAGNWAQAMGIPVQVYPALWHLDGKAAGPIRNSRMLADSKPDLVIAFPGGNGTADMVRKSRLAGVETIVVKP